jgi:hypothetical protein
MKPKENPAFGKGEGTSESSLTVTPERSYSEPTNASQKPSRATQLEPRAGTQLATVLELLRSRSSQWIGLDEIMRRARCGATHSAILTLRQRYGFRIRNRLKRSKGAKAAKSMPGSFHCLRGFFETKSLRWERITPQSWQKVILPGCKAGETKARALSRASELWPEESFILPGCRKPHDGIIDAALIAEFSRRKGY